MRRIEKDKDFLSTETSDTQLLFKSSLAHLETFRFGS